MMKFLEYFVPRNGKRVPVNYFCCNQANYSRKYPKVYPVANASINVIGSGSPGEPASFLLRTNEQCHLFNCGGGTERIARCNRFLRWKNVENIFLTRIDWSRIGGMLSVMNEILTIRGNFKMTIHGPEKLGPILEYMREIIKLPESSFKFNCTESYKTRGFQIDLLSLSSNNDNIAYLCRLDRFDGRLNLEKCVDLEVPLALINQLIKHESISLPDGRLITPNDVKDFPDKEKNFIVIDIPSPEYLHSLEHCEAFNVFLNSNRPLEVVVHFSPPYMLDTIEYKRFLERIKAHNHLIINESNKYSGLLDVHRRQINFNQLNHEIFPLLNSTVDQNPKYFDSTDECDGTIHNVSTHTIYSLRKTGKIEDDENAATTEDAIEESVLKTSTTTIDGGQTVNRKNQYPKIVFLGTSSQCSGPLRNVTSILVHTSETSCILLDCGEGTLGQIHRLYGSKATEIFAKIKAIFISHLHGDHHYGLFEMLLQRKRLELSNQPPIRLMIPSDKLADWITFCSHHIENVSNEFQFIDNIDLLCACVADDMLAQLNISSLQTCLVDHIPSSFGISVMISGCTGTAPFKLTYSGDTIPCDNLVELGQNSTLLIHEATFENALLDRAEKTKHSTIAQAIEQSVKMNAEYTILTHFSTRYTLLPWIDGDLSENIGIAFDNMELVEGDFRQLSTLYPHMKKMFASYFKGIEKNARRHKERQMYKDIEII